MPSMQHARAGNRSCSSWGGCDRRLTGLTLMPKRQMTNFSAVLPTVMLQIGRLLQGGYRI
jgi:hypothetical protein